MNIYQAKVVYAKIGHGTTTENYLVKAHNLTDAEALIKAEVQTRAANDTPIEVKAITKKKFEDVVHAPAVEDTDVRYYIVKVVEEDEKETLHKHTYLISAPSLGEAYETTYYNIPCERTLSIVETDVLDFLTGDKDE
nr:MAG TPA: protein of unknown function (DUF4494) [Caudoviricetes sp.]